MRPHSPSYLDILSGYHYPDILHGEFTEFTKMKYPDINIQIRYPNKLINADTPFEIKRKLLRTLVITYPLA